MNPNPATWLAGTASAVFAIPAGTPMGGYAARVGPAAGTLDALTITALALSANGRELVIVSADIVAVDEALSQKIAATAGITRSSLLLAASHTHSGPAGITNKLHPASAEQIDHHLRGRFLEATVDAIARARQSRSPATLSIGRSSTTGLASNRNDPYGPYDPTVTGLSVRDETGSLKAVVVHWACHPTILGAESQLISADFPGTLRSHLCRQPGPAASAVLYLNGAAGDVSTRFTRGDQSPDEVSRLGAALAGAARKAIENAFSLPARIAHASTTIHLSGWSEREVCETLSRFSDASMPAHSSTGAMSRLSITRAQGLSMLKALSESSCRPRRKSLRLDAWKLGGWQILAVPGEPFASLGQEIVAASLFPTIVVGYAGGYVGYLAGRAAYAAGAYEALASPFAPGSGEKVRDAAALLLGELGNRQ